MQMSMDTFRIAVLGGYPLILLLPQSTLFRRQSCKLSLRVIYMAHQKMRQMSLQSHLVGITSFYFFLFVDENGAVLFVW